MDNADYEKMIQLVSDIQFDPNDAQSCRCAMVALMRQQSMMAITTSAAVMKILATVTKIGSAKEEKSGIKNIAKNLRAIMEQKEKADDN